jgi:hypothetical protein
MGHQGGRFSPVRLNLSAVIEQCFSLTINLFISRENHQSVFSIPLIGFGFFNDSPSK